MALRKDQYFLLIAALASGIIWLTPFFRWLLLPLTLLNTHIHELCHALVTLATAGLVPHGIVVYADGSGLTATQGGNALAIASAGYVGSALIGGLVVVCSRSSKGARAMLWTTFGFLALSQIAFVRGDTVGIISLLLWLGILGLGARYLKKDSVILVSQFLGLQMCFTSIQAFAELLKISWIGGTHSDAAIMQAESGIPDFFWASAWMLFSLGVMFLSLRWAWKKKSKEGEAGDFNDQVFRKPRAKV